MTKPKTSKKTVRNRYTDEFRTEALALADRIGVTAAGRELGLHGSQLYNWRVKARDKASRNDAERHQAAEIVRLKRQLAEREEELAILKKAAAYFAKGLK